MGYSLDKKIHPLEIGEGVGEGEYKRKRMGPELPEMAIYRVSKTPIKEYIERNGRKVCIEAYMYVCMYPFRDAQLKIYGPAEIYIKYGRSSGPSACSIKETPRFH